MPSEKFSDLRVTRHQPSSKVRSLRTTAFPWDETRGEKTGFWRVGVEREDIAPIVVPHLHLDTMVIANTLLDRARGDDSTGSRR
jgi:hypothetical protein